MRIKCTFFKHFLERKEIEFQEKIGYLKKPTHFTYDTFHRICSDTVRDKRKFRDLVTLNLEINFETQKTAFVQYYCEDEILN